MKKTLLFLGIAAFSICVFLTQSCNTNDDFSSQGHDVPVTTADLVVASPEYVAYSKALSANSKKMRSAYDKLSAENKAMVNDILAQSKQDRTIDAMAELSVILKYDIKAAFEKINRLHSAVDLRGVSPEDLLKAIYRAQQKSISSRSTTNEGKDEVYDNCVNACEAIKKYYDSVCAYNRKEKESAHTHSSSCGYNFGSCNVYLEAANEEFVCKGYAFTDCSACISKCGQSHS